MEKFGIYIHLPFCIQKCSYCDFSTSPWEDGNFEDDYIFSLKNEIKSWSRYFIDQLGLSHPKTIYFGGGTPSLISVKNILSILETFEKYGFNLGSVEEITLEVDPGTLQKEKLDEFAKSGVSRFSLGIQSFNDDYLSRVGRIHRGKDSRQLLEWINQGGYNFTADLLFGISEQGLDHLDFDLNSLLSFEPNHISAYVLTVPDRHKLKIDAPSDKELVEMFCLIKDKLSQKGIHQYELSNYAKPGFESKHNMIYWQDSPYWGVGMSSHSYLKSRPYGLRFWNPSSIKNYSTWAMKEWSDRDIEEHFDSEGEELSLRESLFDYLHTSLRLVSGMKMDSVIEKFNPKIAKTVEQRFLKLKKLGLMHCNKERWAVSDQGRFVFNKVLEELTFSSNEVD